MERIHVKSNLHEEKSSNESLAHVQDVMKFPCYGRYGYEK